MADTQSAFDVYDTVALVTHLNGEVGLKQISTKQEIASVTLPRGPLAPLRAMVISSDLKWLAISERSRGSVWDLSTNERRFYVRGFSGGYFDPAGLLYADFPKFQEEERAVGQLNPTLKAASPAYKLEDKRVDQFGPILSVIKPNRKDGMLADNIVLEVRDVETNKTLWTRPILQEAPRVVAPRDGNCLSLIWPISTNSAKAEIASNPDLARRAESIIRDPSNYLIEILDAKTGKVLGGIAVDTNNRSFGIQSVQLAGQGVLVADTLNRLLLYSLTSGEQVGKTFGRAAEVSTASGLIAAENELGQLLILNLSTLEKRDELIFNSPIAMKHFSDDGKRLFVLTAAQTAYVLDVSALAGPSTTKTAAN